MATVVRMELTQGDVLLLLNCLIHATDHGFPNRRFPSKRAQEHIGELYQTIGQAAGEQQIVLEFQTDRVNP